MKLRICDTVSEAAVATAALVVEQGMATILQAASIRLVALGRSKASAVASAFSGQVSTEKAGILAAVAFERDGDCRSPGC